MQLPRRYGHYILQERIAVGGMGEIFRATYAGLAGFERPCAIKRILPHLSDDEEFIDRLISEAKIAVQLTHGNIVQVYELGRIENEYFIAMEWVDGADLSTVLVKGKAKDIRLPLPLAIHVMREVARAVDFAHRKNDAEGKPLGIVHRDISPQNVMISLDGAVKLGDFGIARAGGIARKFATGMGAVLGKRRYMSPEQRRGEVVDPRTDIFALGALLHECVTGSAPDPESPRKPLDGKFPPELESLVAMALAFDPSSRLASAGELVEGLDRIFVRLASQEGGMRDASLELGKFVRQVCPPGEKPVAKRSLTDRMKAAMPRLATPERRAPDGEREATVDNTGVFIGDVASAGLESSDPLERPLVVPGPIDDGELTVGGTAGGDAASAVIADDDGDADEHAVTIVLSKAFAEVAPVSKIAALERPTGRSADRPTVGRGEVMPDVLPADPQGPDAATIGASRPSPVPAAAPIRRGSGTGSSSASTTTGPGAPAPPAAVPSGHVERGSGREPSRAPGTGTGTDSGVGTGRRTRPPAAVAVSGPIDFPVEKKRVAIPWGPIAIVLLAAVTTIGVIQLRGKRDVDPRPTPRPTSLVVATSEPTERGTAVATATAPPATPTPTRAIAADTRPPTPRLTATPKPTATPRPRATRVVVAPTAPPTAIPTQARAAAMGTLNIGADPWAFVYLDGKKLEGTTPLYDIRVKAGSHQVIAENPKLGRREQTIVVKADETKQVLFEFRTPAGSGSP